MMNEKPLSEVHIFLAMVVTGIKSSFTLVGFVATFICLLIPSGRQEAENVCARQFPSHRILLSDEVVLHCQGNCSS